MKSKFITASKKRSKPWKPHPFQRKGVKHLVSKPHAALFLDPGLGKTSITLAAFKVLRSKGFAKRMLVVAPLRVAYSVWPAEVQEWDDFKDFKVVVLHGPDKDKLVRQTHDIYVINYEGLPWLIESGGMQHLTKDKKVNVLVWDELSKMKNSAGKRYKMMKKHLHRFAYRWGLTGSPASNGEMDLFGEIYVLDRGARLGEYITHYRNRFFVPDGPYGWKLAVGAAKKIQDSIKDIALSMSADDYLELPPQTDNYITVTLPPKARRLYDEMEHTLLTHVGEGELLTASSAAAALSKCKQIANGAVYEDPVDPITGAPKMERQYLEIHDAKIEALLDLIEEQNRAPLLVAYEFQHDLARLLEVLPKGTPYLGGGVSTKRAAAIEAAWNRDEIPVLLGHPASIGHGLNLQKGSARSLCWFSPTWDYELYDQFNRRIRRQGTKADRIIVHHILAHDTVDLSVMVALRNKQRTQNALLKALKDLQRSRK